MVAGGAGDKAHGNDAERQRGVRQDAKQRVGGQYALALHQHQQQGHGHAGSHRTERETEAKQQAEADAEEP